MRSPAQRKSDALEKLASEPNVWVATAGAGGDAHLVPLSLCWHEGEVIVAVESQSRTARNVSASRQARLTVGSSTDVVMIDAVASLNARTASDRAIIDAYRERTGWDPGAHGGDWTYIRLRPRRIQVWRDEEEIVGRDVMRDQTWLS